MAMRSYRILTKANYKEIAATVGGPEEDFLQMLQVASNRGQYVLVYNDRGKWHSLFVDGEISVELVVDQIGAARQ